jgi:plastocyanin
MQRQQSERFAMANERKRLIFTVIAISVISFVTGLISTGALTPSPAASQMYMERTMSNQTQTVMWSNTGPHVLMKTVTVKEITPDGEFYDFNNTAMSTNSSGPDRSANQILIIGTNFIPWNITVPAGTTVTWTSKEASTHTVTSDTGLFDASLTYIGASFNYTFNATGVYTYHCTPHSAAGMTGKIIVIAKN